MRLSDYSSDGVLFPSIYHLNFFSANCLLMSLCFFSLGISFLFLFFKLKYTWFTMFQVYINIHIYFLFQILFHSKLLQDTEYSPLCYIVNPCLFLYSGVYLLIPYSQFIPPSFPLGNHKFVFYVCVSVLYITNSFILFFRFHI